MRKFHVLAFVALAVTLSLTGAQEAGAALMADEHDEFGRFLTDGEGRSLYLFTNDERGSPSTCYDRCAENWPPLVVQEAPQAGERVAPSLIGTVAREDGSLQAAYYGWPLYYFARDQAPGDVTGHGVGGVWFLVSPWGEAIAAVQPEANGAEKPAGDEEGDEEQPEDEGAEGEAAPPVEPQQAAPARQAEVPAELMTAGGTLYSRHCAACHGRQGGGGAGPRLSGNGDLASNTRVVRQILNGGPFMPPFGNVLSDDEVAAVATFIRNSWGNSFGPINEEEVSAER
jgi:predicted lipoprotein with Yx(FWY)xxD motif/mono/diheme cytochrome c family protein